MGGQFDSICLLWYNDISTLKRWEAEMKVNKKDFIEKNIGKDGIVGRPIRLNKVKMHTKPDRNYAELIFFGDLHYGHPRCAVEKAKEMLQYALKKRIYILLMGDLIEAGLRESVGTSIYKQEFNPQKQMDAVLDLLDPLAKEGLVIGLHEGNHENRIAKSTGIDISKLMARFLDVPYLGYSCWSRLNVDGKNYSLYSTHGSGGSRFAHTRLKKAMDLCGWIDSDILAYAHLHAIASEVNMRQTYNGKVRIIEEKKQYVVLTGSYLEWDDTYAQDRGFPVTRIGSPKAKIFASEKEVSFGF